MTRYAARAHNTIRKKLKRLKTFFIELHLKVYIYIYIPSNIFSCYYSLVLHPNIDKRIWKIKWTIVFHWRLLWRLIKWLKLFSERLDYPLSGHYSQVIVVKLLKCHYSIFSEPPHILKACQKRPKTSARPDTTTEWRCEKALCCDLHERKP